MAVNPAMMRARRKAARAVRRRRRGQNFPQCARALEAPRSARAAADSSEGCPLRVGDRNIFTFTFGPQAEMVGACSAMLAKSSANTSNETGRSVIAARTLRAKSS
jgi:hypothetical protein